ncbi:GAF domain-containing protein [Acetobacteraceae bacterium H6797]|nr:GAF domain-containing protein [Acetobacteraceae bacterium H6797]
MAIRGDMVKRQRVLADFGEFALGSEDLDEVLSEACRLVGKALGTDLAKVMEIQDQGRWLLVRAGVGWPEGVVGRMRVAMSERSSEAYSVEIGQPVITPDIRREERFDFPTFMRSAGVVGIVNVPILLPGRRPYGLLQVDSREPWLPDEETTEFLRTYAAILGPVIDRLYKVHALQAALDRNRTLLRELQHRIKNNIGAIRGLVRMRAKAANSEETRAELLLIGERIEALRLVHELVYATKSTDRLPLRPYVTQLLEGLLSLHREIPVRLSVQIEEVDIQSDIAVPLGLILNEFATNSLKHAFCPSDVGEIAVRAFCEGEKLFVLIQDDGCGFPQSNGDQSSGTGLHLIQGLCRQINAEPIWTSGQGVTLRLAMPR